MSYTRLKKKNILGNRYQGFGELISIVIITFLKSLIQMITLALC